MAATVVGAVLRPGSQEVRRRWLPSVPGIASAVLASVGIGELVGHLFGRGLAPWTGMVVGAVYLARLGAELNRVPAPPARDG